jgi:transcriptional regulator with XRE-family HTH domain
MNHLGNFIKKKLTEKKLSERELAKSCNLSHTYLNQLIAGKNPKTKKKISPTLGTLEKLANGLCLSAEVLQKIAVGVPEETLLSNTKNRTKFLNSLEKYSTKKGILVGTKIDRVITWDVWNQIKEAHGFLNNFGLDPSEYSEKDWNDLIHDIALIVKIHIERQKADCSQRRQ